MGRKGRRGAGSSLSDAPTARSPLAGVRLQSSPTASRAAHADHHRPSACPACACLQSSPLGPLLQLAGVSLGQGLTLEGPLAQLVRRAAYLYRQPTNEQRFSVAASWVAQAAQLGAKRGAGVLAGGSRR